MIEWALFYADGTFFSDLDGDPSKAPREFVQLAVWRDEGTGWNYEQSDIGYWVWREDLGHFLGIQNEAGWQSYLRSYNGYPLTVFGWTLSDTEFHRVMKLAAKVMEEPKSLWRRIEKRR